MVTREGHLTETHPTGLKEDDELLTRLPIDVFLEVNCRTCNNLRNEEVLVRYLSSFEIFECTSVPVILKHALYLARSYLVADIRGRNDAVLFTTLQTFSNPGGPLYPPRVVRQAASRTLGKCFPQGKWVRTIIKYGFRLLHPIIVLQAIVGRLIAALLLFKSLCVLFFQSPSNIRKLLRPEESLPTWDKTPPLHVKKDR